MITLMTIEDSFIIPGKGVVISGVNPVLNNENQDAIKSIVGDSVCMSTDAFGNLSFQVLDVGVTESIAGKKNIIILLASSNLEIFKRGLRISACKASLPDCSPGLQSS